LKEVPLDRPQLTIGRKPDNDLVIDDPAVSGHHAWIFQEQGALYIEDLDSINGTFVNERKIRKHELKNADLVGIGKHQLIYQEEPNEALLALPSKESEPAEKTVPTPPSKDSQSEQTMILDTKRQRDLLKSVNAASTTPKGTKLGWLTVVKGQTDRKEYELTSRLAVIGTESTATIRLTGWFAPKTAALISRRGEEYVLTEKSRKVLLNGRPVQEPKELQHGDVVAVAGVQMQFHLKHEPR
jgi:pSer/pThr/pTyr-binding forkhead associated (FHA) protein